MLNIALVGDRWYSASLCCNSKSSWWCGRDDLQPRDVYLNMTSSGAQFLTKWSHAGRVAENSTSEKYWTSPSGKRGTELQQHLWFKAGAKIPRRDHGREHFNYIGQGEKTLIFSIQPLQLFIQPLVFCKMKGRLFLVFAEFAQGEFQLSVYHWVTSWTSAWPTHVKLQPVTSTSAPAVPSHCQLTLGTELCKCSCHIADRKFLLV